MKIGLVIYGSLQIRSGGYLYDRKLVEYLHQQGDSVQIVSLPWRNYARHLADNFSASLPGDLARLDVDVLIQDELNHPSLFQLNRRVRSRVRYPIISLVHHLRISEQHPGLLMPLYRWVEHSYLASTDGFVFNSQTTRDAVAKTLGRDPARCVVAFPAGDRLNPVISDADIEARAQQPGPLRLVFLGNLIRRKGLHTVLQALARLPDRICSLTVIGDPKAEPSYTTRIMRMVPGQQRTGRVRFCGPLDQEALAAELRRHHVMVMPSSYEGFGIAYLEAMGFGLPCIASTAGGAREIISHGDNGFLVEADATAALAGHLADLHGDRERLARMGAQARQRYAHHPTWQQSMARIRDFLAHL